MFWKYHDSTFIPTLLEGTDPHKTHVFPVTIQGADVGVDPITLLVYARDGRLLGLTDPLLTSIVHL